MSAHRGGKFNKQRRGGRKQFTAYGTGEDDLDAFSGAAAERGADRVKVSKFCFAFSF